jgi:S1-C subfamily serine protease
MGAMATTSPRRGGWRSVALIAAGFVAIVMAVGLMSRGMELSRARPTDEAARLTASSALATTTTAIVAATAVTASIGIEGDDAVGGIRVTDCVDRGAAARAGIRVGDLVVRLAGVPVRSWTQLRAVLAELMPGERTSVIVLRNGATLSLRVELDRDSAGS